MFRLIPDNFYRAAGAEKRIPKAGTAIAGLHLSDDGCTAAIGGDSGPAPLYFDREHTVTRLPLSQDGFTSFLRLPGDSARECCRGDWENPSYETLMQGFFRRAVEAIVTCNEGFTGKQRILLCVSVPDEDRWDAARKDFRDLLQSSLDIPGWEGRLFVLPLCVSMAVMAREYQKGGLYTRENLLILGYDGSRFRATPVFRGCRNFATAKPGRYHPFSGTLTSESGLGSPLSVGHRCGSFLAQVKTHFALDTSLPEDRISKVLLWAREEALPDLTAAAADAFPGTDIRGGDAAPGLAFAGKIEYLKGLLMDFARNSFRNCLQNTAEKLRLCLTEPAADMALHTLMARTTAWCYYNAHEDSRSFHQAVLKDLTFSFPLETAAVKLNNLIKSWKNAAQESVLADFGKATGSIFSSFSLDDPSDTRPAGSRPPYVPENWTFTLTAKTLENLLGDTEALSRAMIDKDQLFGLKGLTLDSHIDEEAPSVQLRSKMHSALNARQDTLLLYLRRQFDLKAGPAAARLKEGLLKALLDSLETYLIGFTPYTLQREGKSTPEGVLLDAENG